MCKGLLCHDTLGSSHRHYHQRVAKTGCKVNVLPADRTVNCHVLSKPHTFNPLFCAIIEKNNTIQQTQICLTTDAPKSVARTSRNAFHCYCWSHMDSSEFQDVKHVKLMLRLLSITTIMTEELLHIQNRTRLYLGR